MLAVGDAKVVIRILSLRYAVGRSGCAESQDGGRAIGTLSVANLLHGHHFCRDYDFTRTKQCKRFGEEKWETLEGESGFKRR